MKSLIHLIRLFERKDYLKVFIQSIRHNQLLSISLLLAVISVVFGEFNAAFINGQVLATLAGLMLVLGLFVDSGSLRWLSVRLINQSQHTRQLTNRLIITAFLASFLLSNDIAVLTILPLYLYSLSQVDSFKGQVLAAALIVVAANLGGVFFPFSNPQNLIIYSTYPLSFQTFISWTAPLIGTGFLMVFIASFLIEKKPLNETIELPTVQLHLLPVGFLGMILMIAAIFSWMNVYTALLIIVAFFLFKRRSGFAHLDFKLLLTFASFFMIVGNVSQMSFIRENLAQLVNQENYTYLLGLLLSQFMSNVPTTILLSSFTSHAHALLLGVNIGGLGTMIASLANLLGYNVIRSSISIDSRQYFKQFTLLNIVMLILLSILFYPY